MPAPGAAVQPGAMPAASLRSVFDPARIQKLGGVRSFARAVSIPETDIEQRTETDSRLTATVRGTLPYSVAIWVEGTKKPGFSCTCPQGDDGKFCKHAAALALTLHGGGRIMLRVERQRETRQPGGADVESDPVFEFLLTLDHHDLAHLVYDAATRDPRTAQRIEAKVAASVGQPTVDSKAWRKTITATFGRPSRHVDYYEAPRWAEGINALLGDLRGLLDDGEADAVIPLVEYAFERADQATGRVDSSDGCFESISWDIADLHLRACTAVRPDPVALAKRLVELDLHAELDTFRRAAATYADVLGPTGLAEYRRLVQPAFDALGPRADDWSGKRFHLTEAMLGVAQAEGDVDEVIRIKSPDLRAPSQFEEIVDMLAARDRAPEAIDWARRGLAIPGREFQKGGLRDRLVSLLTADGDANGAIAVRLEAFHAEPSLAAYRDLLALHSPAGEAWTNERNAALDWLRERAINAGGDANGSILVQILLHEGDIDGAWDAATTLGCDSRWWMTLARAREHDHPADAIPVYERAVEDLIAKKDRRSYGDAAALMARIERLHQAGGDGGWDAYLAEVIGRHRRKPSFMAKVTERGW